MANKSLIRLGNKIKWRLIAQLALQDHTTFGKLAASIKPVVEGDELKVYAKSYAFLVNDGGQKGTAPPVAALAKWAVKKGIVTVKEAKSFAAYVAWKIEQYDTNETWQGKDKRGFINKALDKSKVDIAKEYGNHWREQIQVSMKKLTKNGNKIDIQL